MVKISPCPCSNEVAVPRDWARGCCSTSKNSPPSWSTAGPMQTDHHLQWEHQVAVQVAV
jgi:hypothetical protein